MTDRPSPSPQSPRESGRAFLFRNTLFEGMLTFLLLFWVVTAIRWIIGPSPISRSIADIRIEVALVGATVGVMVTLLILTPMGRRSGAHMNPAISIAMWRYGAFVGSGVIPYVAAQLAGSVLGVLVGRAVWGVDIARPPVAYGVLQPARGWAFGSLFGAETATMAVIILAVGLMLASRRFARVVPYAVGLLVGGTIAILGPVTGGSANPARQFGSALLSGRTHLLAAYLLAPVVGALLAPLVRDRIQQRRLATHALCGPSAIRK